MAIDTTTMTTIATALNAVSEVTTILETVTKLLPKAEAVFTSVWNLFVEQTPDMTNAERIAKMRANGVTISVTAEAWALAHPDAG